MITFFFNKMGILISLLIFFLTNQFLHKNSNFESSIVLYIRNSKCSVRKCLLRHVVLVCRAKYSETPYGKDYFSRFRFRN